MIYPYQGFSGTYVKHAPLGLLYSTSQIVKAGYEVDIFDTRVVRGDWRPDLKKLIGDDVLCVGVSVMSGSPINHAISIGRFVKSLDRAIPVVWGGPHATFYPETILRDECSADYVISGYASKSFKDLVDSIGASKKPEAVNGVAWRDGDEIRSNPDRQKSFEHIDYWDIPYHLISDYSPYGQTDQDKRIFSMYSALGCPYQCTFCSSPNMWTTRWVIRDPDLLLDEMEKSMATYGATNFDFYDLTFVLNKRWLIDFCSKIVDRGLKITWQLPAGTRSEAIDREVGYWMYRSGCRNMTYTPESGSPSVLKRIKKKVNPESMIKSISGTVKEGVNVKVNLIFGFPEDKIGEYFETYNFIIKMALAGAHDLSIWGFAPYPGTELFDKLSLQNRVKLDDDFYDSLRTYTDQSKITSYGENFSNNGLKFLRITP